MKFQIVAGDSNSEDRIIKYLEDNAGRWHSMSEISKACGVPISNTCTIVHALIKSKEYKKIIKTKYVKRIDGVRIK